MLSDVKKSRLTWDDSFLKSEDRCDVRRLIILDAANILHSTNLLNERDTSSSQPKNMSAIGLLTLMRYFLQNEFNVQAVFSEKYIRSNTYRHFNPAWRLVEANLAVVTSTNILDDTLCLELARQTFGIVVSRDKFGEHLGRSHPGNRKFSLTSADFCEYEAKRVNFEHTCQWTENDHFVGEHLFTFKDIHKDKFFANRKDVRLTLAADFEKNWGNQSKAESIQVIDDLMDKIVAR